MSVSKFTFYKVAVGIADQQSLFRQDMPKNEVVRLAFDVEEPVYFRHLQTELAYVKHRVAGDYIIASLGRKSEAELSGHPSTGFQPITQEEWPHVLIIINFSGSQPFGQTIAVLKDSSVFRAPLGALRSLTDAFTDKNEALTGYELTPNSVSKKESFWEIIRTRTGRIQKLTFDLTAPNFLGLNDEISDSLRQLKTKYNATSATVSIENPEGSLVVPANDQFVGQAVNYATEGAGDIKLKVLEEGVLDGKKNIITASIATINTTVLVESDNVETVRKICDTLFSCLERSD